MMTFRLGIVSSFNVLCGNATYSQALLDGLPESIEPVKIEIPIKLQKFHSSTIEKNILKKVAGCDGINVQMELGLYGETPKNAIKFLKKIIKASKRVSLTMHRVEECPLNYLRSMFNHLKRGHFSAAFMVFVRKNVHNKYKELVLFAVRNRVTFIVHTYREQERIFDISSKAKILVHPIVWPDDYCTSNTDLTDSYQYLFTRNRLPTVGLFGFMSDYKNFLQVVRVALHEEKYNVLLVGGIHPQSPDYGKHISPSQENGSETERISHLFMKLGGSQKLLLNCVHSPEDQDLVYLIKSVDIVVVPYTEVGQSASGIASLAIQFGKRTLFSDTKTARELFKFLKRKPHMFDTKSDLSLSKTLDRALDDPKNSIHFQEHDFLSNINTYLSSLNITLDKK